ncbi:MAG: FAD-binding oxidoreductase [Alphaproteobacteria bacterium]|nr:FAD-binding oxidoreductase [Alphaproteobacteria bacterium]
MRVLICGGGVIGAAIAYFLSCRGVAATVIEGTGLACAASGKSGGFLALDWCDGTPLEALARRSFALHARLPREIGADWGYRRLTTYGGFGGSGKRARRSADRGLDWLSAEVAVNRRLGSIETTAQVHPAMFTTALMRAAERRGAVLRAGRVLGVVRRDGGTGLRGMQIEGEVVEGDAVVIAMGPWSVQACAWLPLPAVFGLKGHSLVFETGATLANDALFAEYREENGLTQAPELFPRADGTTYVCGLSSESPLPLDPAAVAPDPGAIERLHKICSGMSPVLAAAKVLAAQACYRPIARDGLPLIGRVPGTDNAYVATGHSVWGILNAPATGEAVAELLLDGAPRAVDLAPFDPGRFAPLDPRVPSASR